MGNYNKPYTKGVSGFRESKKISKRPAARYVYLLHFHQPYPGGKMPQHYIGSAHDLLERLSVQKAGGAGAARLLQVLKEAGIGFEVARIWEGSEDLEYQLKARRNHKKLCPICQQAEAKAKELKKLRAEVKAPINFSLEDLPALVF